MGGALSAVPGRARGRVDGFEVAFLDTESREVRVPLYEVLAVSLEEAAPVRSFPSYRRQRSYPGWYFSATTNGHVPYESWLERDTAMDLDFDREIVGYAAQPFWLFWPGTDRVRSHAPDFFARTVDGTGVVVDCRPADRIRPRDADAFRATAQACAEVGWRYRLITEHEPVRLGNLRWLAGYRHRRCLNARLVQSLLAAFVEPQPLMAGARAVGDPTAVLPSVFHLLWSGQLHVDLAVRLDSTSLVAAAAR